MRLHDEFTPRGKFASRGKLMHINGVLDRRYILKTALRSQNETAVIRHMTTLYQRSCNNKSFRQVT